MTINAPEKSTYAASVDDLTKIHDQLREKYKNLPAEDLKTDAATASLMSFNGYYGLDTAPGAFFTVDTNMIVINNGTPVFDISLIISIDGTSSSIFSFKDGHGSFDGKTLKMNSEAITSGFPNLDLTFTRGDSDDLVTASISGTIALPNQTAKEVSGTTYNNIISMKMYEGLYYENILDVYEAPVMEIGPNYAMKYRKYELTAKLEPLDSYIYNMNMYFFSFYEGQNLIKLIMGTSPGGGLVCNNLIVTPEHKVSTRSLQTVTKTTKVTPKSMEYNTELAQLSGFYLISSSDSELLSSGAFIAVEGLYTLTEKGETPPYEVKIGVSLDGTTSKVYQFDNSMTFADNTLTIPATVAGGESVVIKFKREYVASSDGNYGSLVSISGTINGFAFTGSTPLNPVPLRAFKGASLSDSSTKPTEVLKIVSDTEIIYKGLPYNKFIYVPLMYILVFDAPDNNTVVLSLGTDGGKGTACIVTNNAKTKPVISSVYGIPDGKSGQPKAPQS